ncbi:retrovirus-related pol polyprotein from transposon TNT 1-94 [Tanacetum coccineum]|uniref:Retrovirus-related pol polyprotein from transposon TNT 1-94 n=1 Tax=Tanacetum coccineum TaxID=301880 RepID=A0ABQ5F067_9ASTR
MVDDKVDKVPFTSTLVDPTSSSWARPVLTNARLAVEVFYGTGHFGMWQSEVLDALFQQGLDIAVEEKQRYAFSKEIFAYKLWVALEEKFLKNNCQNKLFMKKRLFRFTYVPGTTMNDHITSFNQLVTDLMNMDEVFKDQDLALILLGSLSNEYELLETTLLNGKDDVSLSEVCTALYSKELRRKGKQISSSGDAEVLLVRGRSQKKGTDKIWRSKSRQRLSKDECAFCHEKGNWKRDCPRMKTKDNHYKGKAVAEANVIKCDDEESDLSLTTSSSRNASEIWLLDSTCSHHITPHREWFSNFEEHEEVNKDGTIVTLKGVRYSTKLKKNLISVGTLESKGFEVRAKDGVMKIISGVLVVMKGIRKINNTYHYKGRTVVGTVAAVTDGLSSCKLDLCEHCINGKTTRVKFRTAIHKTQGILDYVHSDVWGPSKTRSLGGRHYYVTFVDDFSRRVWVYTLKTKDEVLGVFIKWKKMMETQTCRKIKHLRIDNGGEYKNDLFTKFYEDEGIIRHFTVRHTPQQNGVEAVTYACHLVNRLPLTAIDRKTPFEKWYGKPTSDYDSLHVFGSAAYYQVKESKLDPRAKKALFMGITSGIKGYRLWYGTPTKKVEFEGIIVPADREIDDNSPMVEGDYEEEEVQAEEPRQQQHESIATSKPKRNTKRPAPLMIRGSRLREREVKDCYERRNAVFSEESDMGVDQPPRREEGNWMQMVIKHSSIRILLALVAQLDLELVQMDVKTAFLHGDLEEEIYMVQSEGFKVARKAYEVCKLHKSLYGLKQSPRQWYKRFDKFMMESKYTRSKYDHCVYLKKLQDGSFVYLLLYVDDMLIASQCLDEIEKLKTQLKSKFEMKDLGEAKMILGMEIVRDRKLRKLCLIQTISEKISAAMSSKNDAEKAYMEKLSYANVVGSLVYTMICTRPDISHVVGMVSRYMHNPGKGHLQVMKWMLRYIHNTVDVWLVFEHGSSQWVEGYCDSDYAGDLDKRRSTTGYVFTLAKALVSWKFTLQSTTALSTTEAEYMAMTQTVKEAIWLQGLLGELGIKYKFVTMHSDS